jgi:hypothetical protein
MAEAIQSAVYCWDETVESFLEKFIKSRVCMDFEGCAGFVTLGCRGEELVTRVYYELERVETGKFGQLKKARDPDVRYTREYWTGWTLAYIQYLLDIPFERIFKKLKPMDWYNLYPAYHEMGEHVIASQLIPEITGEEYVIPRWEDYFG